jgi:hypothetical protein
MQRRNLREHLERFAGVVVFLALIVRPATAQTIVQFSPSPDHYRLLSNGTPAVESYNLFFYQVGSLTPLGTVNLGKPSPDATGLIRVDISSIILSSWSGGSISSGLGYEVSVAAVGSGSTVWSNRNYPSNSFTLCSYTISPTTVSVAASGGGGNFTVTTGSSCKWTASSPVSWITTTSNSTGNGNVSYTVSQNSSSVLRTGVVTVGNQTFTINQEGATQSAPTSCTYSLSPTSSTIKWNVTQDSVNVTTANGCGWTVVSDASWITISGGASGTGSGTVTYKLTQNRSTTDRSGTLTIGGQTYTITQLHK